MFYYLNIYWRLFGSCSCILDALAQLEISNEIVYFLQYVLHVFRKYLKVLTNEKKGGLNLVSFDWPRFKLFTLKFSKESVQTPSCERPKTAQQTLFLSFEINNCYP
jgi:hypothetical protein